MSVTRQQVNQRCDEKSGQHSNERYDTAAPFEHQNTKHCCCTGSTCNTNNIRTCQWIPKQGLKCVSGHPECDSSKNSNEHFRQPESFDGKCSSFCPFTGKNLPDFCQRIVSVAACHHQTSQNNAQNDEHSGCQNRATVSLGKPLPHRNVRFVHKLRTFAFFATRIKTGAPRTAVTIPTSSSPGLPRTRPSTSARTSKAAPYNAESGITVLRSAPSVNRTKCGTINPTKPIVLPMQWWLHTTAHRPVQPVLAPVAH